MTLRFNSSITNLCEINESFSAGVLRVCYIDENRNGSFISKQVLEQAIPTMFNCPIVCNYDISSDTIGGHDVELVNTDSGNMRLVHLTDAVGVIPESAKYFWETIEENGVTHKYFNVEVILWKRCPVYDKIKKDGFAKHSMEITVHKGRLENDIFIIEDFTFTAFCLLGSDIEPCFESSQLSLFSCARTQSQYTKMMEEFKQSFLQQDNISLYKKNAIQSKLVLEGGENQMDKITELLAQHSLTAEEIGVDISAVSYDELMDIVDKYTNIKPDDKPAIEPKVELEKPEDESEVNKFDNPETNPSSNKPEVQLQVEEFSLTAQQFRTELLSSLSKVKQTDEWGEYCVYIYCDHDIDTQEVYCWDVNDWNIYGFTYNVNGDSVSVDFDTKKRKKVVYADFEGADDPALTFQSIINDISMYTQRALQSENTQLKEKCNNANNTVAELQGVVEPLQVFAREQVFAQFAELNGIDEFETLKKECTETSLEAIKEKCYAIKGKNFTQCFSNAQTSVRVPVDNSPKPEVNERYGDFYSKYPPRK